MYIQDLEEAELERLDDDGDRYILNVTIWHERRRPVRNRRAGRPKRIIPSGSCPCTLTKSLWRQHAANQTNADLRWLADGYI